MAELVRKVRRLVASGATVSTEPVARGRRRRRALLLPLLPLLLLVVRLWPVMVGRETFYFRDLFSYHLAVKTAQARSMAEGFLPLVDQLRASGQPLVGNLNNVALYPDNLLYLLGPVSWALSAHVWIHVLLAPVALYWLARAWGLRPEASWAAGICYALSGYYLSHANLYNLVAGTTLAPAFAAAALVAVGRGRGRAGAVAATLLWALIVTAGGPMLALFALLLALSACVVRGKTDGRRWLRLALGIGCGTLIAMPQIVELARTVEGSYRGAVGYSPASRLMASWDPRTIVEWLVPFPFGLPDMGYWGERFFGEGFPLYLSLYPGLLALALVLSSGGARCRAKTWSWLLVATGLFLALGGWNPIMFLFYRLPFVSSLRYPVKAWLLVAVGASMLCGLAFDRCVLGGRRRVLLLRLAILGVVLLGAWLVLTLSRAQVVSALDSLIAPGFGADLPEAEVARWQLSISLSLGLLLVYAAALSVGPFAPMGVACALLVIHTASQLWLLGPLLVTDESAEYRAPPSALAYLREGELVAHGCVVGFACDLGRPGFYPDERYLWVLRRGWRQLFPFAGARFGVRYAYNASPDGLDSLLVYAGSRAFEDLDDEQAVRLLAASGVDVVLIGRELAPGALDRARLRARLPGAESDLWIYEVSGAVRDFQVVGRVRGGELKNVLAEVTRPGFDPQREVYLPGRPHEVQRGSGGSVEVRGRSWDGWILQTKGPDPGVLVMTRAFLPHYRASVDGRPTRPVMANMGLLSVEVPAGEHRVSVWVDRRPFRLALALSTLGLLGLAGFGLSGAGERRSAGQAGGGVGESGDAADDRQHPSPSQPSG